MQNNERKDLFTGRMFRRLWGASLISSIGLALGDVADAVVVGQKMGAVGLAAISLCLPIYMVINVCMHGLGIGGSVKYSKSLGEGKKDEAVANFNRILQCAAVLGILLAVLGNVFLPQLLTVLGTVPEDGELYLASRDYARIIILGTPGFFLAYIMNYYLRNDNNEKLASFGFTVANLTDIGLNILFVLVLQMGTSGAALSTVIGQLIAITIYLPGIMRKKSILAFRLVSLDAEEVFGCFRTGFSTSVQYIYQMIFLLIVNNMLARMAGENGIAVFDMLQNASFLIMYLFEGTVKAMQPLLSNYCGEYNEAGKKETFRLALGYGIGVGGSMILVILMFPELLCSFFGLTESSVAALGSSALRIYCIGAFFGGLAVLIEGYYQSCEIEKNAFIMATLRGSVVLLPCTILFVMFGMELFWWMFPVVEMVSLLLFFIWKHFRGEQMNRIDEARVFGKTITNSNEDLGILTAEVEGFCEQWEANMKQTYFVTMTVEEICLAIMQQAFGKTVDGNIQITLIAQENGEFELHIRDNAASFNPFSLHSGKAGTDQNFNPDAMGMMVIKQKAKTFFYRQYQGFNTLIVKI